MGKLDPNLVLEVQGALFKNVRWGSDPAIVDPKVLSDIVRRCSGGEPSAELVKFLRNGARMQVVLTALPVWRAFNTRDRDGKLFILRLAKISIGSLGFERQPTTVELWEKILEMGGEPWEYFSEDMRTALFHDPSPHSFCLPMAKDRIDREYLYFRRVYEGKEKTKFEDWNADPSYSWPLRTHIVFPLRELVPAPVSA